MRLSNTTDVMSSSIEPEETGAEAFRLGSRRFREEVNMQTAELFTLTL